MDLSNLFIVINEFHFRYNPENLQTLESYVEYQSRENTYDLEANLAVLKLYQFNPQRYNSSVTCQILLKALTNFPHTDFVLCKCLLSAKHVSYIFVHKLSFDMGSLITGM